MLNPITDKPYQINGDCWFAEGADDEGRAAGGEPAVATGGATEKPAAAGKATSQPLRYLRIAYPHASSRSSVMVLIQVLIECRPAVQAVLPDLLNRVWWWWWW